MYQLRTSGGEIVAEITNSHASILMDRFDGEMIERKCDNGNSPIVYKFSEGAKLI